MTCLLNKKLLAFAALSLLTISQAQGADVRVSTYYPSVSGEYTEFRLWPRSIDLAGSCTIGSIYVNSSSLPQFCKDNNGTGTWDSISDVWDQSGNDIVLNEGVSNPDIRIGIGTTTPTYKLTLMNNSGIIAKGTFGSGNVLPAGLSGSRLIWHPRKAAFRAGYVGAGEWDEVNIGDYSYAFGRNTIARGNYSVVGGGDSNTANGLYSSVLGGQNNIASATHSNIVGGASNTVSGLHSIVVGGQSNTATANFSSILGGQSNQTTAMAINAAIGGGNNNIISTSGSNIGGGKDNTIDHHSGAELGTSVIGGGLNNKARNNYSVVTGGEGNNAWTTFASIGGGKNNYAGGTSLGVLVGPYARTSGGDTNIAIGAYSTVSGGYQNNAQGDYSAIGGGRNNFIAGNGARSVIAGGERNQINQGAYATIMGGTDNRADGDYSWASGKYTQLSSSADRTIAWGYSDFANSIDTVNAFIIAPGTITGVGNWNPKVGIRDITPTGIVEINANNTADDYINIKKTSSGDVLLIKNGYIGVNKPTPTLGTHVMQFGNANNAYLSAGGVWTNASSKTTKNNIKPLSADDARSTLNELSPVTFNYKATPQQINTGFIAEDVPELVAMNDRTTLSSMDIIAVLTKVAQDQQKRINEQNDRIQMIKKEIVALRLQLGE